MFSEINRAAEEATQRFRRRMYNPQMNVPGIAETYLVMSTLRWPVDFLKEYAKKPGEPSQLTQA